MPIDELSYPYTGLPELDSDDWAYAFDSVMNPYVLPVGSLVQNARLRRSEVVEIRAIASGLGGRRGTGDWWIVAGRDSRGRRFLLAAWREGNGWSGRRGGLSIVASSYAAVRTAADNFVTKRHVSRVRSQL